MRYFLHKLYLSSERLYRAVSPGCTRPAQYDLHGTFYFIAAAARIQANALLSNEVKYILYGGKATCYLLSKLGEKVITNKVRLTYLRANPY